MTGEGTKSKSSTSWVKIFILCIFAGGFAAFFILGGHRYLNFETIKANRALLLTYTQNHYWGMLAGSVVVYTASTALSLPIATVLSLAIGFLFGLWVGIGIIIFSATLGATLVFLAARYLFAETAQRRMGATGKKIISGFHENAFNYLLFLRLVALFPFWLVNLAPAFTPIKLRTYVVATAIGITPGSFVFANLGQSLGSIETPRHLLSLRTLSAFMLLGVLALIPVVVEKFKFKKQRMTQDDHPVSRH
ncbi:MAG: TVP38/TMEM64 family protein [Thermodesulfobacteriota bacterium]